MPLEEAMQQLEQTYTNVLKLQPDRSNETRC